MRAKPPKTRKINFTYDEFKDYFWSHTVMSTNSDTIFEEVPMIKFIIMILSRYDKEKCVEIVINLFPLEYRSYVKNILLDCLMKEYNFTDGLPKDE